MKRDRSRISIETLHRGRRQSSNVGLKVRILSRAHGGINTIPSLERARTGGADAPAAIS